ncbi:hypothetical protein Scep_028277 [Stephania cephalantha]|uniref:Uncharacterized protein n=1 Tax=Stephania cephalantha TaxID=152367 RepID=A0AAP0EBT4_9MAGN
MAASNTECEKENNASHYEDAISLGCAKLADIACNSGMKFDRVVTCIRRLQKELARIDIVRNQNEQAQLEQAQNGIVMARFINTVIYFLISDMDASSDPRGRRG